MPKVLKESDREKLISDRKRDKKEEEKQDKRRAKEDAKKKEQEKKLKRKSKSSSKAGSGAADSTTLISDFVQSEKNFIPLFLEKCVEFIEQEGLDSEGIYRVPGNRAHVDLLYQKLQEGEWFFLFAHISLNNCYNCFVFINFLEANIDIDALDIPVNAVATALKDFFSKHLPSLFDADMMAELEDIAGVYLA